MPWPRPASDRERLIRFLIQRCPKINVRLPPTAVDIADVSLADVTVDEVLTAAGLALDGQSAELDLRSATVDQALDVGVFDDGLRDAASRGIGLRSVSEEPESGSNQFELPDVGAELAENTPVDMNTCSEGEFTKPLSVSRPAAPQAMQLLASLEDNWTGLCQAAYDQVLLHTTLLLCSGNRERVVEEVLSVIRPGLALSAAEHTNAVRALTPRELEDSVCVSASPATVLESSVPAVDEDVALRLTRPSHLRARVAAMPGAASFRARSAAVLASVPPSATEYPLLVRFGMLAMIMMPTALQSAVDIDGVCRLLCDRWEVSRGGRAVTVLHALLLAVPDLEKAATPMLDTAQLVAFGEAAKRSLAELRAVTDEIDAIDAPQVGVYRGWVLQRLACVLLRILLMAVPQGDMVSFHSASMTALLNCVQLMQPAESMFLVPPHARDAYCGAPKNIALEALTMRLVDHVVHNDFYAQLRQAATLASASLSPGDVRRMADTSSASRRRAAACGALGIDNLTAAVVVREAATCITDTDDTQQLVQLLQPLLELNVKADVCGPLATASIRVLHSAVALFARVGKSAGSVHDEEVATLLSLSRPSAEEAIDMFAVCDAAVDRLLGFLAPTANALIASYMRCALNVFDVTAEASIQSAGVGVSLTRASSPPSAHLPGYLSWIADVRRRASEGVAAESVAEAAQLAEGLRQLKGFADRTRVFATRAQTALRQRWWLGGPTNMQAVVDEHVDAMYRHGEQMLCGLASFAVRATLGHRLSEAFVVDMQWYRSHKHDQAVLAVDPAGHLKLAHDITIDSLAGEVVDVLRKLRGDSADAPAFMAEVASRARELFLADLAWAMLFDVVGDRFTHEARAGSLFEALCAAELRFDDASPSAASIEMVDAVAMIKCIISTVMTLPSQELIKGGAACKAYVALPEHATDSPFSRFVVRAVLARRKDQAAKKFTASVKV